MKPSAIFWRFGYTYVIPAGLLLMVLFVMVTYFKWGPTFTSDTLMYFGMANEIRAGDFPMAPSYSPGYPFMIALVSAGLGVEYPQAAFGVALSAYLAASLLTFLIFREFDPFKRSMPASLVATLLLVNSWWSIRILLNAHADGLLYVLHLLVVLFLLRFLRTEKWGLFVFSCIFAALAFWTKKNSLVYLPFLAAVPLIWFGFRRRALWALAPIAIIGVSVWLFRVMNGTALKQVENAESLMTIIQRPSQVATMMANLADTGFAVLSSFFTDKIAALAPSGFLMILAALFLAVCPFLIRQGWKDKSSDKLLMAFPFLYILGMGLLFQIAEHTEMNQRTLFPAVFVILVYSIHALARDKFKFGLALLAAMIVLQPMRTVAGTIQWFNRAPMDSFVHLDAFLERPSLGRLNEMMLARSLGPEDVYTNNLRYLTAHFGYRFPQPAPAIKKFKQGKWRNVNEQSVADESQRMYADVAENNALIVFFDVEPIDVEQAAAKHQLSMERVGNDVILSATPPTDSHPPTP